MSKFVAGHVTKVWFLKLWITSFWTEILHLNFKEIVEKIMVVAFTAHLSVTIKRLTRYKQKEVLAAMLEGKGVPSNMVAITLHYFVEKSKCHKIAPLNLFPLKFQVWDNFYVLSQFLASAIKIPTHCLKEVSVTWLCSVGGLSCNLANLANLLFHLHVLYLRKCYLPWGHL